MKELTKMSVKDFLHMDEKTLISLVEAVDARTDVVSAIEFALKQKELWGEEGVCTYCGADLKYENNGYKNGEGPCKWEVFCLSCT